MEGKTIVHLADYGGPYSGNFINSLLHLNDKLISEGSRMVIIFSDIAKDREWLAELEQRKVPYYFVSKTDKIFKKVKTISDIVLKENGEILHTHFSNFDIISILVKKVSVFKNRKLKVIWHVHSDFPKDQNLKSRLKTKIKFNFFGDSAKIITVSKKLENEFIELGVSNIETILNGIDITRIDNTLTPKEEGRKFFNILGTSLFVFWMGSLY